MTLFSPVNGINKKIHIQVARQIAQKIMSGQIAENEKLPNEIELCEMFSVSRTALRESMKLLSAKGLISSKPKVGTKVEPRQNWYILDSQLIEWLQDSAETEFLLGQFLALRKAIEPEACALASVNATVEQRKSLSVVFQKMSEAANSDDSQAWIEQDMQFHCIILQSTGNNFFTPFGHMLSTIFKRFIDKSAEGGRYCLEEHNDIYTAIMTGNPTKARNASAALLSDNNQRLALSA